MELWIIFMQCKQPTGNPRGRRTWVVATQVLRPRGLQEKFSMYVKFAFGENICYNGKSLLKNKGE